MKNKRKANPYPCFNRDTDREQFLAIFSPVIFMLLFIASLIFLFHFVDPSELSETPVRYIRVNGQDCIVKHVIGDCTSTMACCGYDEAVCPNLSIP